MASPIREKYSAESSHEKLCRACTDFQTWAQAQKKTYNKDPALISHRLNQLHGSYYMLQKIDMGSSVNVQRKDCPLDSSSLGKATWAFLHTLAAYYPNRPTQQQEKDVKVFFDTFSRLYPCAHCAADFQKQIKVSPPATKSQEELTQWLCRMHNNVNKNLGKPLFDCSRVNERWRDGWKDGSCD